jgi:hypothetical protein
MNSCLAKTWRLRIITKKPLGIFTNPMKKHQALAISSLVSLAMALSASLHGGTMFPIVTNDTAATGISVACAGTNYLAGINGDFVTNNEYKITAQLFGPAGAPVGARINPLPGHTSENVFGAFVASSSTNFLMVWPDDYSCTNGYDNINAQIVSPSGDLVGGWFAITTNSQQGFTTPEPVAYGATEYLVVWDDYRSETGYASIYGQLVSADGALIGGNFLICAPFGGAQEEKSATVAFDGTNFLVTWFNVLAVNSQNTVYGAFVSPSGIVGTPFEISQTVSAERNPLCMVFNGTNYFVVWNFASQLGGPDGTNYIWSVHGRFVTPSGSLPGNELGIVTNANKTLPYLASDGANYLLAWETNDAPSNPGMAFQFLDAGGHLIGTPFTPFSAVGSEVPLFASVIYDGKQFVSVATLSADGQDATNHTGVFGAFIPVSATTEGSLQVTLTGGGSGAEWQVDTNGTYRKSGITVSNLSAGSHTVSFKPVPGWNTPTNQTVTLTAGTLTRTVGIYTVHERPLLTVLSPRSGLTVSTPHLAVTGTVRDDVAVASVNYRVNSNGWLPATSTNADTNWTQTVTLIPGSNTVSLYAQDIYGNLSLTNNFGVFYSVLTPLAVTVNGPGRVSPDYNGSNLVIGKPYAMTATPDAGCKLTNWSVSIGTNAAANYHTLKLNFLMASAVSITANFRDVTPPTISLTAPASTKSSNSAVTLSGKAHDNVGVQSVYYTVNGGPVNGAVLTTDGFTNWSAVLILSRGTNLVRFYASDGATNISLPATITLVNESGEFAPQSISGLNITLNQSTPQPDSPANIYCGMSTFAYVQSSNNFFVGDYVFSMLDSNTVQMTRQAISPAPGDAGSLTLMFSNTTSGTYTNSDGDGGTFALSPAAAVAPFSVDGSFLDEQPGFDTFQTNLEWQDYRYVFTNGSFTYPTTGPGTYTWAIYSPQMALLTATFTNAQFTGVTKFDLFNFADGSYVSEWDWWSAGNTYTAGPFVITPAAQLPAGFAPESLAGWKLAETTVITQTNGTVERGSGMVSFGTATTGGIDTLGTNFSSEAGNYTYSRTGPTTGLISFYTITPPPDVGADQAAITFTSATSGNFSRANSHRAITLSQRNATVPPSLVGTTLTFTPVASSSDSPTVATFGYDTLNSVKNMVTTPQSYTFGQFGPQTAQLQTWDASKTNYLTLWFTTPSSGNFVSTKLKSGGYSISNGTFKSP